MPGGGQVPCSKVGYLAALSFCEQQLGALAPAAAPPPRRLTTGVFRQLPRIALELSLSRPLCRVLESVCGSRPSPLPAARRDEALSWLPFTKISFAAARTAFFQPDPQRGLKMKGW